MSAVHAAEVAQGGLGRSGFVQEMIARNLVVVRQAEVAVLHASEQEGVVLGEFEGFCGAVGVCEVKGDFGGHGSAMRRDILQVWVMEEKTECRRSESRRWEEGKCGRDLDFAFIFYCLHFHPANLKRLKAAGVLRNFEAEGLLRRPVVPVATYQQREFAFVLNYTAINPLVPGTRVSVLPVLQMLLLLPLTFGLTRKLVRYLRPD